MKKLKSVLLSRSVLIGLLILLQVIVLLQVTAYFSFTYEAVYLSMLILSIGVVIYIINNDSNPSYKIAWILVTMSVPFVGGLLYICFGGKRIPKALRKVELRGMLQKKTTLLNEKDIMSNLAKNDVQAYGLFNYMMNHTNSTTYDNTAVEYYSTGLTMYNQMLEDIKSAKTYIFMEFFIMKPGYMWDEIYSLLKKKIAQGVEVCLMYDDYGTSVFFDSNFESQLKESGIKIKVFNRLKPLLAVFMNNRDHRKILVVDGKIGYTGGINIADEYIDKKIVFGKWKDGGIRLVGSAVDSLVYLFLHMFNEGINVTTNYDLYRYMKHKKKNDGLICPFGDSPTDDELVGRDVHLSLINVANKSICITTPYLILDQELRVALGLAAKRGVDVKIIVPHVPDKKLVNQVTKSNYDYLVRNGVKIYEYTPGFIHLKSFLIDDKLAYVGTINMDYRSYYMHFECGVILYQSDCLDDIIKDVADTLAISQEITLNDVEKINIFVRVARAVLNLLAPLM